MSVKWRREKESRKGPSCILDSPKRQDPFRALFVEWAAVSLQDGPLSKEMSPNAGCSGIPSSASHPLTELDWASVC